MRRPLKLKNFFTNLSNQDLAKIRTSFNSSNNIELLHPEQFQTEDCPPQIV